MSDVATALSDSSYPGAALAVTELDDPHADPHAAVLPILHLMLRLYGPDVTGDENTVMLVDPVLAALVAAAPLALSPGPE